MEQIHQYVFRLSNSKLIYFNSLELLDKELQQLQYINDFFRFNYYKFINGFLICNSSLFELRLQIPFYLQEKGMDPQLFSLELMVSYSDLDFYHRFTEEPTYILKTMIDISDKDKEILYTWLIKQKIVHLLYHQVTLYTHKEIHFFKSLDNILEYHSYIPLPLK